MKVQTQVEIRYALHKLTCPTCGERFRRRALYIAVFVALMATMLLLGQV